MKEYYLAYIAGVFDCKGYIKDRYIIFNFKRNLEIVSKISDLFNLIVDTRTYREKNKKSFIVQISGKDSMVKFLEKILPYSTRKLEIRKELMRLKHERSKKILRKA